MNLFLKLGDCRGVETGYYGDGYEPNKVCMLKKAVSKYTTFIFMVCISIKICITQDGSCRMYYLRV